MMVPVPATLAGKEWAMHQVLGALVVGVFVVAFAVMALGPLLLSKDP